MDRFANTAPLLACAGLGVLAVLFTARLQVADDSWPVPQTGPLTFTLIGSFFASACAAMLWCIWERQPGALFGLGLDFLTIFGVVALFSFDLADGVDGVAVLAFALACGGALLAVTILPALRSPTVDHRRQPPLVRWSFIGSVLWLLAVGVALVLKAEKVLPWPVSDDLSVIVGGLFLGAGAYLGYGLLRPSWANSGGQLAAFLAYDVVLLYPLLAHFDDVASDLRVNLFVYSGVVIYSALLAGYFLFVNMETRIRSAGHLPQADVKAG
jgi:hypothetical protein